MEPITVPAVPREAFNKDRPISDLVKKQVEHFKHIEEKLPADIRAKFPQYTVATENEAAHYIGAMTSYLLSRPRPKETAKKVVVINPRTPPRRSPPLALAAAAVPGRKKSAAKKKSAPKKQTTRTKTSPSIRAKAKNKTTVKRSSSKRKK